MNRGYTSKKLARGARERNNMKRRKCAVKRTWRMKNMRKRKNKAKENERL